MLHGTVFESDKCSVVSRGRCGTSQISVLDGGCRISQGRGDQECDVLAYGLQCFGDVSLRTNSPVGSISRMVMLGDEC